MQRLIITAFGRIGFSIALAIACAGAACRVFAGTVDISVGPPELTQSVSPNLVLTLDDSGSMAWHYMPDRPPYAVNRSWNAPIDDSTSYPAKGGPYLCAGVIDPAAAADAGARGWSMNGVYFNPNNVYAAPLTKAGAEMPAALFNSAWDDGIVANRPQAPGASRRRDLGQTMFCGNVGAGYYRLKSGVLLLTTAQGQLDPASVARLYTPGNWEWVGFANAGSKARQNFANWYSYHRTRRLASITAISRAFSPLSENVRIAWQNINSNPIGAATRIYPFVDSVATNQVRTRFYDWLFATPASGGTPNRSAAIRVGELFRRNSGTDTNPYWERELGRELSCRQNFHVQMTDGLWNGDQNIRPPGRDTNAIASLPDGRSFYPGDRQSAVIWNENANSATTMADIAFHYWASDLRPDFKRRAETSLKVPTSLSDQSAALFGQVLLPGQDPRDNKEIYWNPANDPASWPHLVQHVIGFGTAGTLQSGAAIYQQLRRGEQSWPVPAETVDDGRKIDDMWHAALNSRGKYFATSDPAELSHALNGVIGGIVARKNTSVAARFNSSVLRGGVFAFAVGYDSTNWSGTVKAHAVLADGKEGAVDWDAGEMLDRRAANSRVIFTSTSVGNGKGVAFRWPEAGDALIAKDPGFDADGKGAARLDYLRGERSAEGTDFRVRGSVLGAVVHAQALYVSYPVGGYRDAFPMFAGIAAPEMTRGIDGRLAYSYETFLADHYKRAPTIYVGGNDGMLHAFDATTSATPADSVDPGSEPNPGAERWAYVPHAVFDRLSALSSAERFTYVPTVDATPVARDVFFRQGSQRGWRTILVGGLRYGGRGIYALDITRPDADERDAASKVLWEFTHESAGASHLGYTFGLPNIGRLANGGWVVLVPGGYFPHGEADPAAANRFSSLFILDAQTGSLIRELKTPEIVSGTGAVESFGLGSPVLGDYNGDQVDDVAFAGDLTGHVWRFDLASADPAQWKVHLLFRPARPGDHPVTTMPRLFADPTTHRFMVVFGTGKYLAGSDATVDAGSSVQAIYGIREPRLVGGTAVIEGRSSLVQQIMTEQNGIRFLTRRPVPAADVSGRPVHGWYIALNPAIDGAAAVQRGERVVVTPTPLFNTGRLIVTTLIPATSDPCNPDAAGAVFVVDALSGAAAAGSKWGEGSDVDDEVEAAGETVKNPPTSGNIPAVGVIGGGQIVIPGSKSERDGDPVSAGDALWRRRSWRALDAR
jgi:type IV pilus assembly protein PilY1